MTLGSEDVTTASTLPPLVSLTDLHSLRNDSMLLRCTGSLYVGLAGSVLSGKVHRCRASGVAWRISSLSGPGKLEEKGTLKERWTTASDGVIGETGVGPRGRFMD